MARTTTINIGGESIFLSLLTVALIILKFCGVISWGWLWVLAPLWIPLALLIALALAAFLAWGISAIYKSFKDE